jgi:hypothetical protein
MTAATYAARRTSPVLLAVVCSAAIGAEVIRQPSHTRLIVAACIGFAAIVAASQWPRAALIGTLVFLPYLALSRRLLLEFAPWKSADPLLVVAPVVLLVVLVRLFVIEKRPMLTDGISKLILFLLGLSVLEAFNPRGGGLSAGLSALLFAALPLLWFFAGRAFGTRESLRILLVALVISASVIAMYGLLQTWDGMPSWDQLWIQTTGYEALHVGNVIRAFGTFSSSEEYGAFLATGLVIAIAFALDRRPYLLPVTPLLGVALFYESSRGATVSTVVAALAVLSARTGSMRRAAVTLALLLVVVVLVLIHERNTLVNASSSSNALVAHQVSGLAHPLNSNTSTLNAHLSLVEGGFKTGLLDPIGRGIATTTIAGSKLGSGASSTEVDLSNEFVATGTFGGFAYLTIVILAIAMTLREAIERRDAVSLSIFGLAIANLGQWLNGGFYAVSPLIWFAIGFTAAVRPARPSREAPVSPVTGSLLPTPDST